MQGVALAREKLAGHIDGVGNNFSEKFEFCFLRQIN